MAEIKAIETFYNGYRFRSRLEARWAVFYDALGIEYEYEPEGFDLGDGYYYLPDFYLPETNAWVEIKGREISNIELEKIIRFCESKCDFVNGGSKFRLLEGQIPYELVTINDFTGIPCYNFYSVDEYNNYLRRKKSKKISRGILAGAVWVPQYSERDIVRALLKARQARFEHGECG